MNILPSTILISLLFAMNAGVNAQSTDDVDALKAGTGQLSEQAQPLLDAIETPTTQDLTDTTAKTEATVMESTGDLPMEDEDTVSPPVADSLILMEQDTAVDIPPKDIMLVLDNSGSMKKNDPQFLGKQAALTFINGMDAATRVGVIVFDESVRMEMPLTQVDEANRQQLMGSLDKIDYRGQWTESPAAIERAIYELKNNARDDVRKFILFLTDGMVDTGDPARDIEQARWLKGELAADAAKSGIRVFGIAYTENADFHLIQSIAQTTDGEYYRAMAPEDLQKTFQQIKSIMNTPPEPEPLPEPEPAPEPLPEPEPVVQAPPPPPPEPVIIEVPVARDTGEEDLRNMIMIVAISAVLIALIAILILLMRRRGSNDQAGPVQEAYVNDINGFTDHATYKLGSKPTMLGRVAGKDTDHLDYIVIPQTTIGRRHALIEYKDFSYWIIDQGSINGTFVNDKPISTETRLKHGDRIRLHKYELEFSIPELAEDGMTVMSSTVLAGSDMSRPTADVSEDATVARGSAATTEPPAADVELEEPEFDLDFDITDGVSESASGVDSEDVTAVRDANHDASANSREPDETEDEADETIMLNDDDDIIQEDEADFADGDATIRRKLDDKASPEHFVETAEFNVKDLDKDK